MKISDSEQYLLHGTFFIQESPQWSTVDSLMNDQGISRMRKIEREQILEE